MREVSASEKGIWWAAEGTQELGRPLPGSDSESLRNAEDTVLCAKSLQLCPTSLAHNGC